MSDFFVHSSSVVDEGAKIGAGTKIWHFVHISADANIGTRVSVGQNVFIANGVFIGDDCKIQNNVSLYEGVVLERGVFCGPSAVFTNVINPRAMVERKTEYKQTRVGEGASLGANCTIVCGVSIGKFAFVGAGAVVKNSVPDYAMVVGNPAVHKGWYSKSGLRLKLPLSGNGTAICSVGGDHYILQDGICVQDSQ